MSTILGTVAMDSGSKEATMTNDPTLQKSERSHQNFCAGRGLNEQTIKVLRANGIEEPERLLFMTEAQIKVIPGIGKVAMSNIAAYRAKFLR
jgi:hypothetical protein